MYSVQYILLKYPYFPSRKSPRGISIHLYATSAVNVLKQQDTKGHWLNLAEREKRRERNNSFRQ